MRINLRRGTAGMLHDYLATKTTKDLNSLESMVGLVTDTSQLYVIRNDVEDADAPLSILLVEGKPLGRSLLGNGEVSLGTKLVVGTAKGDYVFEGVTLSIVTHFGQKPLITPILLPSATITEGFSDDHSC
tara:strand:+ start:257 stop:646 length:390 start_codon:yes stop_codon:yes gene_type:complete